jgi:TATA-box binding protein (TBP) (component of TFIID and TFIIIB)
MADKKYESLKIENIVASGAIAESIDLVALSEKIENCELNKKRFPGAVYRIQDPKIAALIFSSGKVRTCDHHKIVKKGGYCTFKRAQNRYYQHGLFIQSRQIHQS